MLVQIEPSRPQIPMLVLQDNYIIKSVFWKANRSHLIGIFKGGHYKCHIMTNDLKEISLWLDSSSYHRTHFTSGIYAAPNR